MSVVVVTGSGGLVGSEAARRFASAGYDVVGIDNDMRRLFFGSEASTLWNVDLLEREIGSGYWHFSVDIRNREAVRDVFRIYAREIEIVVHAAGQPSRDWGEREPSTDFAVNAMGTLNLLEAAREFASEATFIHTSTSKVYGDGPNGFPLVEQETRYEVESGHTYYDGVREDMTIDACHHSVFGASKAAADLMVQEYGRTFGLNTVCFRSGVIAGKQQSATAQHGLLSYLMRCVISGTHFTVFGYKGKQVRDVLHAADLVGAFVEYAKRPRPAEVYNIGGGRSINFSIVEAIERVQAMTGKQMEWSYLSVMHPGDPVWYIANNSKFQSHYPDWSPTLDLNTILEEIRATSLERWSS
ncbi:MAG: NAD-dependent epimerase/dehydratase family protein [Actinomycetota bacterium]